MKTIQVLTLALLFLAVSVSGVFAQQPTDSICTGIAVIVTDQGANEFTYTVAVSPGATISINGGPVVPVQNVDTLYVHPNAGLPTTPPTTITALNPNWVVIPYTLGTVNNFGYVTGAATGVAPGQAVLVGSAAFAAPPPNQTFVVRVNAINQGAPDIGFCSVPGVIGGIVPEPGSLALLGMGLLPMAGLLRRFRR